MNESRGKNLMVESLDQLARINLFGAPFLLAFGMTWIICGFLWTKIRPSNASLATLVQGGIAFPLSLFGMYIIGAFENQPDLGYLDNLSILISMSQLLILPLLIAMFKKKHYSLIPFVFSAGVAVHFPMYSWLYRTVGYIVMPIGIAIALSVIYTLDNRKEGISSSAAAKSCYFTGFILLLTAVYFIVIS